MNVEFSTFFPVYVRKESSPRFYRVHSRTNINVHIYLLSTLKDYMSLLYELIFLVTTQALTNKTALSQMNGPFLFYWKLTRNLKHTTCTITDIKHSKLVSYFSARYEKRNTLAQDKSVDRSRFLSDLCSYFAGLFAGMTGRVVQFSDTERKDHKAFAYKKILNK